MTLLTSTLLFLLPALASAQTSPSNTTNITLTPPVNVTSIGGYPNDQYSLLYYWGTHKTNVTNAINFQGFNWSVPVSTDVGTSNTNSSETWQMHFNYSTIDVPVETSNAHTVTSGVTVVSMTFPEQEWSLNSSWKLCASFPLGAFPDSIASKATNNSDGSCVPYLGQSCVDALMSAYETASSDDACTYLPDLSSIKECSSVANAFSGGIGAGAISTTTPSDLVLGPSGTYINTTNTNITYTLDSVAYQGISSGQSFAYYLSVFPSNSLSKSEATVESKKVHLMALQIMPSDTYMETLPGGYAYTPNTRLICARANTTSGALGVKNVPLGLMALGVIVVGLMGWW